MRPPCAADASGDHAAEDRRGLRDGPEVRGVGAAAAEVADHGFLDLVHGGVGVAVEEGLGRHHEARRAEAALHAAVLDVGVDEGVLGAGDALDGLDGRTVALDGEHHAGEDGPSRR